MKRAALEIWWGILNSTRQIGLAFGDLVGGFRRALLWLVSMRVPILIAVGSYLALSGVEFGIIILAACILIVWYDALGPDPPPRGRPPQTPYPLPSPIYRQWR